MSDDIVKQVRGELNKHADATIAKSSQRFFKEEICCYGIKTAVVNKIARDYFKGMKDRPKGEIFELCTELWEGKYMEESIVACHWSYAVRKSYTRGDFATFKRWIMSYVSNWAQCDTLCNHTVGAYIEMYPDKISELKKLTRSENRWARRGAAVSLIIPARHGLFLEDVFEIADALLVDKDDMVRKGYGWMLKAAAEAHQQDVFDYVMTHKQVMPRTSLQYAIEKMPKSLKSRAMERS